MRPGRFQVAGFGAATQAPQQEPYRSRIFRAVEIERRGDRAVGLADAHRPPHARGAQIAQAGQLGHAACQNNPRRGPRAGDQGRACPGAGLWANRASGEVDRARTKAVNHMNARTAVKDPVQTGIIAKWTTLAGPIRSLVVGSVAQSITGDASGNRGIETPMGLSLIHI